MAKGFNTEQQLEEYHTNAPDIDLKEINILITYLRCYAGYFRLVKALRCLVPVGANALGCQLYFVLVFAHHLAKPKVCNFDFTVVKDDVLRFQVIVDNFLLLIVEVL